METLIQIAGWVGTFFIVFAYFLVSYKKVGGDSKIYQAMNLLGGHRGWSQCLSPTSMASRCLADCLGNYCNYCPSKEAKGLVFKFAFLAIFKCRRLKMSPQFFDGG